MSHDNSNVFTLPHKLLHYHYTHSTQNLTTKDMTLASDILEDISTGYEGGEVDVSHPGDLQRKSRGRA